MRGSLRMLLLFQEEAGEGSILQFYDPFHHHVIKPKQNTNQEGQKQNFKTVTTFGECFYY